jgi:hypothetical protein
MLAWQIHSYNLEKNLTGDSSLIIPFKGLIVANAVTDYRSDPHIHSMETLSAFNLIPPSLYEAYEEKECKVPWTTLWNDLKIIPLPELECLKLFGQGLKNVNGGRDIYDFLNL